jgi:transcriptional regulator with XRE-family HTH domain
MPDDETYFKRQGFWLRMARERAGKSQKGAALHLGLSENSKSSVSDYESGTGTHASQETLLALARWYEVPLSMFTNPLQTSDEVIDRLIDEASRIGEGAEQRDWVEGRDRGREADDGPSGDPGRLSA